MDVSRDYHALQISHLVSCLEIPQQVIFSDALADSSQ